VPVVVKDVFETAELATAFGSAAFDGTRRERNIQR
jgi:Asp-tRNA(Asn)/Glu-tRNA(Gln) amidotransferase A subunit family amidase